MTNINRASPGSELSGCEAPGSMVNDGDPTVRAGPAKAHRSGPGTAT